MLAVRNTHTGHETALAIHNLQAHKIPAAAARDEVKP
jgi:hypothetical protein